MNYTNCKKVCNFFSRKINVRDTLIYFINKNILFLLASCSSLIMQAQFVETYNEFLLNTVDLLSPDPNANSLLGYEPAGFTGATGFTDASVTDYVKVFFDHTMNVFVETDQTIYVHITIKKYPVTGPTVSENIILKVTYRADNLETYTDIAQYTFSGFYKFRAKVTEFTSDGLSPVADIPANLKLGGGVKAERYFTFSTTAAPTLTKIEYLDGIKSFRIKDFLVSGALYYDVEWTFADDYSPINLTSSLSESEIQFAFKNNSTRIRVTPGSKVYIPAIFDRGYIIVRARGIGPSSDPHKLITGKWSIQDPYDLEDGLFATMSLSGISSNYYKKIQYTGGSPIAHMKDMSWMLQTSYAEDGKMKFVVQYYDATGRVRQTATMANTEKEALITETIYDYHGRAVFQSLSAPAKLVATPVDGYKTILSYEFGLNKTTDATPVIYDKTEFVLDPATCMTSVPAVGTSAGAGLYYSEANPKKTEHNSFIPNSYGYPFTFTQYLADNTGRIAAQSGVGETHKLGNGHEVKYLYGTPDQPELDRLFGGNVGSSQHYFKTATIDPNEQVSVSYTDMDGHIIATALAGPSPENVDELKSGGVSLYTRRIILKCKLNF